MMSDHTLIEKITEAIFSTEAFAAFFGAFAAFLLEAIRRWRSDRLANLAAGNEAVFALAQMYTMVTNVNDQMFVDRIAKVSALLGRPPNYAEFIPIYVGNTSSIQLRMEKLGFLLDSYDPDILRRVASCDGDFAVLMDTLVQRNHAHVEWQERSSQAMFSGQPLTLEQLEAAAGMDLSLRLRSFTEHLQKGLPSCAKNLMSAGDQLTRVLAMSFPTRSVTSFKQAKKANAVEPHADVKPRLWRRIVRRCYRVAVMPIRFPKRKSIPAPGQPEQQT